MALIPNQRALFEIPEDVAYLNCAYMGPLMRSVRSAGEEGVGRKSHINSTGRKHGSMAR